MGYVTPRKPPNPRGVECKRGHDDWAMRPDGSFRCKECERQRNRDYAPNRRVKNRAIVWADSSNRNLGAGKIPYDTFTREELMKMRESA